MSGYFNVDKTSEGTKTAPRFLGYAVESQEIFREAWSEDPMKSQDRQGGLRKRISVSRETSSGTNPSHDPVALMRLIEHRAVVFQPLFEKLGHLQTLEAGWDTYDAPPPNTESLDNARFVLDRLRANEFVPSRVTASVEGGVGLCFERADRYADFECFNSGEILGTVSNRRGNVDVFEVNPTFEGVKEAINTIRAHITT